MNSPENVEQPRNPAPAGLPAADGSDGSFVAGFYWWRAKPDDEWRMVQLVETSPWPEKQSLLCAYDVEKCSFGGRSFDLWRQGYSGKVPFGEWLGPVRWQQVPTLHIIAKADPLENARYAAFRAAGALGHQNNQAER